ncbi:hypothetical protein RB595_009096 [Gaeumannomyces hyphopodioides]
MANRNVDYSLYLVTDSTPAILGGRDICAVVEQALRGGVTVVQYRDKTSDTRELVDVATRLHRLTREHNVPLLINDRVDVALAVGCEGVHLGQDDMSLEDARRLLGPDAIIGISVNNGFEAIKACYGGADYLGVGAVFATPTKADTRSILGTAGLQYILGMLTRRPACRAVPAVAIGGINRTNVQRVFYQSEVWPFKRLHGVAVVSAIVAAPDPEAAARELRRLVRDPPPFATLEGTPQPRDPAEILALVPGVIGAMHETTPLSHNMTNLVVQNFSANVALAVGASPIMSNFGEEAADLARLGGALVVNMGTVTPEGIGNYIKAIKAYNLVGRPVVFDPVGAGATAVRRAAVKAILAAGYLDVIKGNEGEIATVLDVELESELRLKGAPEGGDPQDPQDLPQQRGVDSGPSTRDDAARALLAVRLARLRRCVVVMTGATDFVADPARACSLSHGHVLLSRVTGTGCSLGTVISAACSVSHPGGDRLVAAVAALLLFNLSAEVAAGRCQGRGTFVPAFLDVLADCRVSTAEGDTEWLDLAQLRRHDPEDGRVVDVNDLPMETDAQEEGKEGDVKEEGKEADITEEGKDGDATEEGK